MENLASDTYDCIIVGGGPGGLTAGEYLGRFLRKTLIIDAGRSRAAIIPKSHNYPGFPEGIAGEVLLEKLRDHVRRAGAEILDREVTHLAKNPGSMFEVYAGGARYKARTVLLATGIIDDQPGIPGMEKLIYNGVVRFCPVCDGFEAMDKSVAIIGPCAKIYGKARFLRTYTSRVHLFPLDKDDCAPADRDELLSLGVSIPDQPVKKLVIRDEGVTGIYEDGTACDVDILYPAMGAKVRLDFLKDINLAVNDSGCVHTDARQQTNIEGLYAVGDITLDLSQISVAVGQAAIAATSIHNRLPLNCRP